MAILVALINTLYNRYGNGLLAFVGNKKNTSLNQKGFDCVKSDVNNLMTVLSMSNALPEGRKRFNII